MNFKTLLNAVKSPKVFVPLIASVVVAGAVLVFRSNSGMDLVDEEIEASAEEYAAE